MSASTVWLIFNRIPPVLIYARLLYLAAKCRKTIRDFILLSGRVTIDKWQNKHSQFRERLIERRILPNQSTDKALYIPFKNDSDLQSLLAVARDYGSYLERGGDQYDVEKDSRQQQLIVYGYVVLPDGRFMLYQRGSLEESESRLHGKVSLGIGGHMEPTDASPMEAFARELVEELRFVAGGQEINFIRPDGTLDMGLLRQYLAFEPRGIIKDERDDVGRVHLGIACRLIPLRDDLGISVRAETGENVLSFFVKPAEYLAKLQAGEIDPEGWTDIVFRSEINPAA